MTQRQRFLTPQGRDQLQQELDVLRTVRRPDVAARIHQATEGGGTVDNAEYEEVKNEQAFVEGRIRDLEEILANAVVAERSPTRRIRYSSAPPLPSRRIAAKIGTTSLLGARKRGPSKARSRTSPRSARLSWIGE